jgi:GH24 family phage-related lysozyme (muramidase)
MKAIGTSEILGHLKPEHYDVIAADPTAYKKASDIEGLLGSLEETADKVRQTGFAKAKEAKKLIKERPEIKVPKKFIQQALAEAAMEVGIDPEDITEKIARIDVDMVPIDDIEKELQQLGIPKNVAEEISEQVARGEIPDVKTPTDMPKSLQEFAKPTGLEKQVSKKLSDTAEFVDKLPQDVQEKNLVNIVESLKANSQFAQGVPDSVQKIHRDTHRKVRGLVDIQDPEVGKLMGESAQAIDDENTIKQLTNLKLEADKTYHAGASSKRKMQAMFAKKAEEFVRDKQKLTDVLDRYQAKGLIDDIERVQIQKFVKDNTKIGLKGGLWAQSADIKFKVIGLAMLLKDTLGTKMQETLAKLSGSKTLSLLGKGAKGVGKAAWKSVPVLGAGLTYSEARAAGATPEQALALTTVEEITDLALVPKLMAKHAAMGTLDESSSRLGDLGLARADVRKAERRTIEEQDKRQKTEEMIKDPSTLEEVLQALESTKGTDNYVELLNEYRDTNDPVKKAQGEFVTAQNQANFDKILKKKDYKSMADVRQDSRQNIQREENKELQSQVDRAVSSMDEDVYAQRAGQTDADKLAQKIDLDFMTDVEGRSSLIGVVPQQRDGTVIDNSGVRIGKGIDLGKFTKSRLESLRLPKELSKKLMPFIGLKNKEAVKKINQSREDEDVALELTAEEAENLQNKVNLMYYREARDHFKQRTGKDFEALSPEIKTALFSLYYNTENIGPKTAKYAAEGEVDKLINELENYYEKPEKKAQGILNRRKREAKYLKASMGMDTATSEEKTIQNLGTSEITPEELESYKASEGYAHMHKNTTDIKGLKNTNLANRRIKGTSQYGLYYDKLGYLTAGFGHKIKEGEDPKDFMNLTEEEATQLLINDIKLHTPEAEIFLKDKGIDPSMLSEQQMKAMAEWMFQMGRTRANTFFHSDREDGALWALKKGIETGDYTEAEKRFRNTM